MARLSGLDGRNSAEDMKPSSSASQSKGINGQPDVSLDDVAKYNDGCFCFFDLLIAHRRYLIRPYSSSNDRGSVPQTEPTICVVAVLFAFV